MRTYDVDPLFRSGVGFDRLLGLLDQVSKVDPTPSWPPYNIEKVADDRYRITMAVAGFAPDELELVQNNTTLLVAGQRNEPDDKRQYLHRGIAARSFRQTFNLAEYVKVTDAALNDGLLTIELVREVPEAMRPRRIEIAGAQASLGQDSAPAQVESQAKAA